MYTKAVVLLGFLLVSSLPVIAPSFSTEPVRVYVDPPAVIDPDVLFNVSVKADNLVDLVGVQWQLMWDPILLRAVDMTEVMFHEVTPQSEWDNIWRLRHSIDNELGSATYVYLWFDIEKAGTEGYCPISGNHTMATICFQVLGMGNCTIRFTLTELSDPYAEPIGFVVTDGFFSNSVPLLPPVPIEFSEVLVYVEPRRVRNDSLTVNETFAVDVKVDSLTNHSGIVSSDFWLSWNPTLLNCTSVTEVMFHEVLPESEWQSIYLSLYVLNDLGMMGLESTFRDSVPRSELGEHAIFGNHTLATITFIVKDTGSCTLDLFDCLFQEYDGATGVGQMLHCTVDGYFANTLNGDLNGDNIVDLFDALAFGKSFGAHWNGFGWNEAADINGDMQIDIFDAILLGNLFGRTS